MSDRPLPPLLRTPHGAPPPPRAGSPYAAMIDTLRGFLDGIAVARLDDDASAALAADLAGWTARLAPLRVGEDAHMFGRVVDAPGHGQTMCPAFAIDTLDAVSLAGRVSFGGYFHGANGAAHGGSIALLFDEVLGIPANSDVATIARTAYLHVNYRSITPIDRELHVSARVALVDGRKRIVRGELRDGERLCADAEGLFVELRPGQR